MLANILRVHQFVAGHLRTRHDNLPGASSAAGLEEMNPHQCNSEGEKEVSLETLWVTVKLPLTQFAVILERTSCCLSPGEFLQSTNSASEPHLCP